MAAPLEGGANDPRRDGRRAPAATDVRQGSGNRLTLMVLCLASLIAVVDITIVSIALPAIRRELGFSDSGVQWILNGYALAFGGLLLPFGRVGDLWGRRRLFVAGLACFAVAALSGGLAWEPWILVAARCLQGAAAAAFIPASLSLLTTAFAEGEERNRAIGLYGAMAALGFVVGMVGGGIVTEFLGWRWVMFVNVPVALAALLPARRAVAESRDEDAPHTVDLAGASFLVAGLASLLYAVSKVPEAGWGSVTTLGFTTMGVVLLIVFATTERRVTAPLLPLPVLATRAVVVPNAAIFLQSMVGIAWLYALTIYFQEVLGFGPLAAGLLFLPMTLASVVAASAAGRLTTRAGVKSTAGAGLLLVTLGVLLMTGMSADGGLPLVISGMVIGEAGFMLSNVPLTIAGSTATGEQGRGLSAGLLNTSTQLGNAVGLGVVASVAASAAATLANNQTSTIDTLAGLRWGLLVCAIFPVLALAVVLLGLPSKGGRQTATSK
jgi:EmrB/QacA subfamily drug resistance transporter